MPLTAILCPCADCKGEVAHDPNVALDHLARRKPGKFTFELLASMLATQQERGNRITTTLLTGKCLRSEYLKRRTEYTDDPEKLYASFRGTMFHGQLEEFAHPGAIAEARFHIELEGLGHLSGSPDLVDPKVGYLYDYKFTKENPRFDYPWKEHVAQLQINRWLVDNGDYVELKGEFFPLTERGVELLREQYGDISLIPEWDIRTNRARFVPIDWQGLIVAYMDDKGPKPILITRSEDVPKKDGKGTRKARVADVWDDETVEALVRERYEAAREALLGGVLPDIEEAFQNWQHPLCGFCPVKGACIDSYIDAVAEQRRVS